MKKPGYVYHGSGRKLLGNKLIPRKASDLGKNPDNILKAVYASEWREDAIAMGILSCKGVGKSSLHIKGKKITALLYEGSPQQEYFYLYTLSSKNFENRPKGSHQWVSFQPIKPKRIEKISIKDYTYLVRKASAKEKREFFKRYKKGS